MRWFSKSLCRERRACADCRLRPRFRESLHRAGLVDSPDFACPHGIDLTNLPLPAAKVTVRKKGCRTCKPVAVGG